MLRCSLLLLPLVAFASSDEVLYEYLQHDPALGTHYSATFDPSGILSPSPAEENLLPRLHRHGMVESLKQPFVELRRDYLPRYINVNEELPCCYKAVIEDALYLQLLMLSSIGVLALMPENVTSWNKEELRAQSLEERWKKNVSTLPVWDKDDWAINYIGHPVSGAWYYTMARNDGMSIGESAVFSAVMSTFFWEYGYEAFAEVPSLQDLISTPLLGSILGEGMYLLERKLDERGGVVLGSKLMGDISYFLIDPLGNIAEGIQQLLQKGNIDLGVTMTFRTYPAAYDISPLRGPGMSEEMMRRDTYDYGFVITFQ